jgi:hypothetical protein
MLGDSGGATPMTNETELESALKFLAAEGQKCDRMDALKELLAKVESGFFPLDTSARDIGLENVDSLPLINTMFAAFGGSLDAAKALHEAVLPGWGWHIRQDDQGCYGHTIYPGYQVTPGGGSIEGGSNPARAWLIAILRALIAEGK